MVRRVRPELHDGRGRVRRVRRRHGAFLAEYKNGAFASLGACADPIQNGDEVLFAYAVGTEPLLALAGPATARPGEAVTVRVTDAGTGAPVAGASVGGNSPAPTAARRSARSQPASTI